MVKQPYLQRPDLFRSKIPPHRHQTVGKLLLDRAHEAQAAVTYQPNVAILIRTKNDAIGIRRFFKHVENERKNYKGRIDIIIVDTESQDETVALAKKFKATLVYITQAEFTYPKAINKGLAAVKSDITAAFITIGHAQPILSNCLLAGARHFKDPRVVGVYGLVLPHENASKWEKLPFYSYNRLISPANKIDQARMGTMGATNCMIRMGTWRLHPFDEAYARGGEDQAWAQWALKHNYEIVFEPALSVHHSHGLGPINLMRQYKHWRQISKPLPFDQKDIKRRRPDLFK